MTDTEKLQEQKIRELEELVQSQQAHIRSTDDQVVILTAWIARHDIPIGSAHV